MRSPRQRAATCRNVRSLLDRGPRWAYPPRVSPRARSTLDAVRRALALVWRTDRQLTLALAGGSLIAGLLPVAIAGVGERLVDAIVRAAAHPTSGAAGLDGATLTWLMLELGLVAALVITTRLLGVVRALLRARLGHHVNVRILEKALAFDLAQFEDPDTYDRITRARREASTRPLSLVTRTFEIAQHLLALAGFGALLLDFSALIVLALLLAGLPAFIAEARFARDAFRLFNWRTPETREQNYLETVLARDDHAKEVKLFGVGPALLGRYVAIFDRVYGEDRALTIRRGLWGAALGVLAVGVFYGAYGWIALATIDGGLSLGAMTMYLWVFKQGQTTLTATLAAVGGLYEDTLYLTTLTELLETPVTRVEAPTEAAPPPRPDDGLRLAGASFTYPGNNRPALDGLDLHIPRGTRLAIVGDNGSGKTTLVKLLAGFYAPSRGRLTYAGRDIAARSEGMASWDPADYRRRVSIIFQDFNRYQLTVGENIGAGDADGLDAPARWPAAAEKGLAAPLVATLPDAFTTRLGRWFKGGRELSLGQWQKIALARAFMRPDAEILILDEPTASMDAEAEAAVFARFREVTEGRIGVVISHRFSTVRMADVIIVLDAGRIVERGSHTELIAAKGRYAHLYAMQSAAFLATAADT